MGARSRRVYLTGADGMLGRALTAALAADPVTAAWPVHGVSLADFDITDADALHASVAEFRPDIVVHTAAHAIVDDCELDPRLALRVNVEGVRNVAEACRRSRARLVYISSDYVFDGRATPDGGYRENDLPGPVNVYGLTKVAGERISELAPDHLAVRTSWLFGGTDERVDTVLDTVRRLGRGETARLIHDQYSRPTYTVDLARAIVFLLTRQQPVTGTVHVANAGTASWYEVGRAIRSLVRPPGAVEPIALDECGFLGARPVDSSLHSGRLAGLGLHMPHWRDALRRYLEALDAPTAGTAAAAAVAATGAAPSTEPTKDALG
ncbi:dTDP-4-dehydrorhamnose reductase [Streptomyces sp. NPDC007206]|uniref:dTDP-4-dehydrorhamnose reductase n=1 Tax=Streptomyces sp. NPDC007206 TaxID=3154317 RepID=UPI0033FB0E07